MTKSKSHSSPKANITMIRVRSISSNAAATAIRLSKEMEFDPILLGVLSKNKKQVREAVKAALIGVLENSPVVAKYVDKGA